MKDELISKVMDEVMKKMGASDATSPRRRMLPTRWAARTAT